VELPGQDLVDAGVAHLRERRETVEALLVSVGARRLRAVGIDVPEPFPGAEIRLYELLRRDHGDDAHGRYNALLRRLVSFERAAECAS
jgi:hypothetical protein